MIGRKTLGAVLILTVFLAGCLSEPDLQVSTLTPRLDYQRPAFGFTEVVDGVYRAQGTENVPTWCNAVIIINESDVVIVDSHVTPMAALALLEELREITQKPVRYLINTHFHFDHTFGNQAYPDNVQIIGHDFTQEAIASGGSISGRAYDLFIGDAPSRIASMQQQLDTLSNAEARAELAQNVDNLENLLDGVQTVEPTAPNISFSKRMTLHRGDREIQVLCFGRGHTGGNLVVYLPDEGVLITGDLLYPDVSYMGDAYYTEWVETLEQLKSLEFDWIIGGHGPAFQDRNRIDYFQSYLRDFWTRVQDLYEIGVSAGEAATLIDMRDHAEHYPSIQDVGVHPHATARAYELLDEDSIE